MTNVINNKTNHKFFSPELPIINGRRVVGEANGKTIKETKQILNWFQEFIESHSPTITSWGNIRLPNNKELSLSQFRDHVKLNAIRGGANFPQNDLNLVINEWLNTFKNNFITEERARLSYDQNPTGELELKKLVEAITGKQDSVVESVLQHTIWQIKRKLNDLNVDHHMMAIFFGAQGVGKSELMKKLITPWKLRVNTSSLTNLTDDRGFRQFAEYSIIIVDELRGADKASIERIKDIVTQNFAEARVLYTQDTERLPNRSILLGSSNIEVRDVIRDSTGNRRFFQINVSDKMSENWGIINDIDYLSIWRSVDENANSPIIPVLDEVKKIQDDQRFVSLPIEWLKEILAIPSDNQNNIFVTFSELRTAHINYLKETNKTKFTLSNSQLGTEFSRVLNSDRKYLDGVQHRGYWVSNMLLRRYFEDHNFKFEKSNIPDIKVIEDDHDTKTAKILEKHF